MKNVSLPGIIRLQALVRGFVVRRRFLKLRNDFKNCALELEDPSIIYFPSTRLCAPIFLPLGAPIPEPISSQQSQVEENSTNPGSREDLLSESQLCESEAPAACCDELSDGQHTDLTADAEQNDRLAKVNDAQSIKNSDAMSDVHENEAQSAIPAQVTPEIPEDSLEDTNSRLDEVRVCLSKAPKEALLAERKELVEDVRCILEMMSRRTDYLEQRAARTAI